MKFAHELSKKELDQYKKDFNLEGIDIPPQKIIQQKIQGGDKNKS